MKITVEIELTEEIIIDVLYSGFESNSYWCYVPGYHYKNVAKVMTEGLSLQCIDTLANEDEITHYDLTKEKVENGLKLMKDTPNLKRHFSNILEENFDAETGDVLLQLALLGEVRYG